MQKHRLKKRKAGLAIKKNMIVYFARSKKGRSTFTVTYSAAMKLFKMTWATDEHMETSIATFHTLLLDLDQFKPRLRHYNILRNDLKSILCLSST